MGGGLPIRAKELSGLKEILHRAVTRNQLLILSEVGKANITISSLLLGLSEAKDIPLSTLKTSAKTLRQLGVIEFGGSKPVRFTGTGKLLMDILGDSDE